MDLDDLVGAISDAFGTPAVLEDRDFNLVAFNTQPDEIDAVRAGSILRRRSTSDVRSWFEQFGIATAAGAVRTPAEPSLGILPRLCLPVRWNGVTYGYFWLLDPEGGLGTPAQLEATAAIARDAGALLAQRARGSRDASLLLTNLLAPDDAVSARAVEELDSRGLVQRTAYVVVVHAEQPSREVVPLNLWSLPRHVLATSGEGFTTLLVDLGNERMSLIDQAIDRLRQLHAQRLGDQAAARLLVGVGDPQRGVTHARTSHEQARRATKILAAVPRLGAVAHWSQLGVHRLISCGPRSALVDAVLDPRAQRLLDEGGELVRTAQVFLDRAGNIQELATELAIHRQTAYYRLRRIETITGFDLHRGEDRLVLHLALTMAPLLLPTGQPSQGGRRAGE
ncbi:PucR family transcriptional regulator [Kribbella soli]|uniref:PucR family transcriptional regulator n=1 Tax=Kribbella soli TaxID=1124743 RepID=A0A4R0HD60_9ACTN|nr:PucR family transcriptional regulator [Kribbella soli]TCC07898.1 PucR family transcriptional regulator [Kribbella soli]